MATTEEIMQKIQEPVKAPDFWPMDMMDEFHTIQSVRNALDFKMSDGSKVDIHTGTAMFEYMAELQVISASAAELMGRLRKRLEQARGRAILEALDDIENFKRLSATLQAKLVDSKIAEHLAVYEYAEFLSKRISYSQDGTRSMLSFIKEDMRNQAPVSQR